MNTHPASKKKYQSAMNEEMGYLISLLEDEFLSIEEVRVIPLFPSTLQRSPDLEQDYDPESHSLHTQKGVRVHARGKEYFFPIQWVSEGKQELILKQVELIREQME